ncbi:hypothetical protein Celaphus_00002385 [Cervus elaphus hippelaphus]|uniref:Uncharacterized protein n=1 Tax=Cervus elaphus hippelaphus TaxID=46360 RepID=A0A212CHJ6_CEREH|nr:hypothetical protein Celaphus_00002385 [Cervus elaphus hippelaphus]
MCAKFKVSEVNKLDGKASINHHKGKFTFFYEWSIKRNWTGTSGVQYKGHVEIPNLVKIVWMKWRLVDDPDTNLLALKNQQHPQNRVHTGYDIAYNHGESVDPAWQPALKTEERKVKSALSKTQVRPVGFTELVPEKHIARKWRFKSWPKGGFATITLTFVDRNGENELCLEG